jgi:hypothetical protein
MRLRRLELTADERVFDVLENDLDGLCTTSRMVGG